MNKVSQIRRNCDLYTAKMVKATDTPSESCIWERSRPENAIGQQCSNPTAIGENTGFEDAAASKGFDSNLPSSARGIIRERGNQYALANSLVEG